MRIRFSADYDHKWPSGAETAYKAGMELTVRREAGEGAIAAGKGKEVRAPRAASSTAPKKAATPGKRGPGRPPKATPTPAAPDPVPAPSPAPPAPPADEAPAPGAGDTPAPIA